MVEGQSLNGVVRVAAADDHPFMLDGYRSRLAEQPTVTLVATCRCGEDILPMLMQHPVDVLIADIALPTSAQDARPYETLIRIGDFIARAPELAVLVISYHNPLTMMNAALDAGASGYIQKDDMYAYDHLIEIIHTVHNGESYFPTEYFDRALTETDNKRLLLSPRQMEVLAILTAHPELTSNQIGELLGLRPATVRNILSQAYVRLGTSNRTSAVLRAQQLGLLDSPA